MHGRWFEVNRGERVLDRAHDVLVDHFNEMQKESEKFQVPEWYTSASFFRARRWILRGGGRVRRLGARGVRTGEYGPSHFFDRPDDLFYIAELGQRYKLSTGHGQLPGKIGFGAGTIRIISGGLMAAD